MPHVTVEGLTLEKEQLEHEITLLQQKNDELQADLDSCRDRSRSHRRKVEFKVEPISARTMMALDICLQTRPRPRHRREEGDHRQASKGDPALEARRGLG